ncbi:MAG: hypothetical protein ACI854_001875 [Arenicella sp.]|jgi:hypothetical protein
MSNDRHTAVAYLLLILAIGLVIKFILVPMLDHFQAQYKATNVLQKQVLELQLELSQAERKKTTIKSQLHSMINAGNLIYVPKQSEASYRLHELLKASLETHSISISQLRPINYRPLNGVSKSALELNFQAPAESLQAILSSLAGIRPRLHIELLSLRNNERVASKANRRLEVSLSAAIWHSSDVSLANIRRPTSDAIVKPEVETPQPNMLVGLFDQGARSRLRSPSLEHYRLAAINISQSARIAIIANSGDGKIRRLEQGGMLDTWRVESIDSSGVSLKIGERQETLTLIP